MIDIAWSHILLLAMVALIFLGPKELPIVLRTVGRWVGKARALARDFQQHLEELTDTPPATPTEKEQPKLTHKRVRKR